jgi:hypothetical protein
MNNVNHEKHEALRFWFKDFVKQAHIKTAPPPAIAEVSERNPKNHWHVTLCLWDVIANICKLNNTQEKLILLLQCIPGRIQHLLAAVPMHLSRDFAKQHDEAISKAVAATLELGELTDRDKLLLH